MPSKIASEAVKKFNQPCQNDHKQNPPPRKKPKFDWAGSLKALRDQYTSVELQKVASDLRIRGSLEPTWKHYNTMENALIKDGWTITDHWLRLQRGKDLYVDLSGKQFLTAQKENRKIAVMVKISMAPLTSQTSKTPWVNTPCIGMLLKETEPDRTLYLAVHEETFATIFEEALGQLTIRKNDLKLIVFNKTEEVIVKWNA